MIGWILHRHSDFLIKPETYQIQKLIEEGEQVGNQILVFQPE